MTDIVSLQRNGAQCLAEGNIEQAIELFTQAYRLEPANALVLFNLAAVCYNEGRHDQADHFFRRALLSDPTFARAHGHVVISKARNAGPNEALVQARRLAFLAPLSAQTLALATQYLFELDRHEAVTQAGRRSLVVDPTAAGLYRLIGLSASLLQRLDASTVALSRACVLQPGWADARLALAGAKFAQHDFEGALAEATRAAALGAYPPEAAFLQARASLALNEIAEADRYFARAVALEPKRQVDASIARLTMNQSDFERFHEPWGRNA